MGWKLVRDRNEEYCRAHGVSGEWRTSPDPRSALLKKIFEEAGEYAERRDPAELYDLIDVVRSLIRLEDPTGEVSAGHHAKVADMGGFARLIEWCPVPGAADDGTAG
jgi:predicted house-cleaning noncanonical NTP pyrophosphatase (MazG superfamily)